MQGRCQHTHIAFLFGNQRKRIAQKEDGYLPCPFKKDGKGKRAGIGCHICRRLADIFEDTLHDQFGSKRIIHRKQTFPRLQKHSHHRFAGDRGTAPAVFTGGDPIGKRDHLDRFVFRVRIRILIGKRLLFMQAARFRICVIRIPLVFHINLRYSS